MRRKDEFAIDKIIECAKREFAEKGFEGASMRAIAENAGYTTGMLYARFADKGELFREIVKEPADRLYNYYTGVQNAFASLAPETQYTEMHGYVDGKIDGLLDIVYENFDEFKLIVCKSKGSEYERFIDKLIDVETENTGRFIEELNAAGIRVRDVRVDMAHMLATAMFNGMFEVVAHDFDKVEAHKYVKELQYFFNAGWDKILGLPSNWTLNEEPSAKEEASAAKPAGGYVESFCGKDGRE